MLGNISHDQSIYEKWMYNYTNTRTDFFLWFNLNKILIKDIQKLYDY